MVAKKQVWLLVLGQSTPEASLKNWSCHIHTRDRQRGGLQVPSDGRQGRPRGDARGRRGIARFAWLGFETGSQDTHSAVVKTVLVDRSHFGWDRVS